MTAVEGIPIDKVTNQALRKKIRKTFNLDNQALTMMLVIKITETK